MFVHLLVKPPRICKGIKDGSFNQAWNFPESGAHPARRRLSVCASLFAPPLIFQSAFRFSSILLSPRRGEVFPEDLEKPSMSLRGQICSSTFLEVEDGSRSTSNLDDSWRCSGDLPERSDGVVPHRVDPRDRLDELTRLHRSSHLEDGDDHLTDEPGLGRSAHGSPERGEPPSILISSSLTATGDFKTFPTLAEGQGMP